ncbi:MAG: 3-hydroxy-3-methylglutaryl-CoA reductase, partial [Limosilactobacillus sp.]
MSDWQHGFYRIDPQARRERLAQALHLPQTVTSALADHATTLGNELVENYLTDYSLPEGVGLNLTVNEQEYVVPMVVEEPSVIAAASNGAKRVQASGGFTAPHQHR